MSRLGEINKARPSHFMRVVAQATNHALSERVSRSGEGSLA